MPNLREEITKTFTRITRRSDARSAPVPVPDLREGRQFGAYRIVRSLGAGGMGQVYLALDTRLGRHVALKFLPPHLVSDRVSLARLVQEARAASALNHPNILTIYDVGELEGEHFIVSEFVDGVTLRSAMERETVHGHLPIDVAMQTASALSAAHAAGVVHRDLKPTNIMLRPDGYVKVIDFGLAKLLHRGDGESGADLTRTGSTLGTADYMSPEQARGEPVDHRTDIWSLGVILYEMVAGHRPFEGATQSHVMVAIQDHPVPALPKSKSIPPALRNVVSRALAKRPKDRYSSAGEMLRDLRELAGTTRSGSGIRLARVSRRFSFKSSLVVPALLLVLLAIASFAWWRSRQPRWLHVEPVRQLTFNGRVQLSSMSPDGRYLAYAVGQKDGQQALYLKQIDSPADELKVPPRKIAYEGLTFSPDNQTLYVVEKDDTLVGRLYAIPLLGARPNTPVVVDVDGPISFSPAGDRFAFVRYHGVNGPHGSLTLCRLMLSSLDGQNQRPLLSTDKVFVFRQPVWSPDGGRIAAFIFEDRPNGGTQASLDLINRDGSESRRLLPDWRAIGQPQWTPDAKSLVVGGVSTYSDPSRRYQLHQLSINGVDRLLTNDLAAYNKVSLSADGRQMTAVKTDSKAVVWISQPNDFKHGSTLPAQAENDPSLAWEGANDLLIDSRRNGFPNLGLLDTQTQSFTPLTNERFVEQGGLPIPGSNGKSLVFDSNRGSGEFHVWRFDADTNQMRQLTFGANYDEHPSVSPDGRWIVYTSWSQNLPHLMKVSTAGGPATQIRSYSAQDPQISPDGTRIACYLQNPASKKWAAAIISFDGTGAPQFVPQANPPLRWSPDGQSITTSRTGVDGVSNIWLIPVNGADPAQLTDFEDQSILSFAWSPSGDRLACLRVNAGADVALFKTGN